MFCYLYTRKLVLQKFHSIFFLFFLLNEIQVSYFQNVGCPTRVRCDPGTENGIIARCQMFLRKDGIDSLVGEKSYYEGSSVINQVSQLQNTSHNK